MAQDHAATLGEGGVGGNGWGMVFPARPGEWFWLRGPNCEERLEGLEFPKRNSQPAFGTVVER